MVKALENQRGALENPKAPAQRALRLFVAGGRMAALASAFCMLSACSGKSILESSPSDLSSQASDRDPWGESSCLTIERVHKEEATALASAKPDERSKAAKVIALAELARRNHCMPEIQAGCAARVLYLSASPPGFPEDVAKSLAENRVAAGGWALIEACAPKKDQGCFEIVKAASSAPIDLSGAVKKAAPACFSSKAK